MWRGVGAGSHSQTRLHGLPHRWVPPKTGLCLRQGAADQQADQSQGDNLGRERVPGTAVVRQAEEVIGQGHCRPSCLLTFFLCVAARAWVVMLSDEMAADSCSRR